MLMFIHVDYTWVSARILPLTIFNICTTDNNFFSLARLDGLSHLISDDFVYRITGQVVIFSLSSTRHISDSSSTTRPLYTTTCPLQY